MFIHLGPETCGNWFDAFAAHLHGHSLNRYVGCHFANQFGSVVERLRTLKMSSASLIEIHFTFKIVNTPNEWNQTIALIPSKTWDAVFA